MGVRPVADMSDPAPDPPSTSPPGRKKLVLKKRDPVAAAAAKSSLAPSSGKSNPFGAARPREETLLAKGVDVKEMDAKLESRTTAAKRLTRMQREEADIASARVARAEAALREANEKEMPENALLADLEAKRAELAQLLEKFAKVNIEAAEEKKKGPMSVARSMAGSRAAAAAAAATPSDPPGLK